MTPPIDILALASDFHRKAVLKFTETQMMQAGTNDYFGSYARIELDMADEILRNCRSVAVDIKWAQDAEV